MITFKADDGYSYIIDVRDDRGHTERSYRIDSGELKIQLATNHYINISRLDISPEISLKLKTIRGTLK